MELTGEVVGIIYQNEINGYCIADFYVNETEDLETIVGYLPFIVEGDNLKLIGKYVEHREYGKQFKVEIFEKIMPTSLESLQRYLGNGSIKGVGPATAKKIISKFKENTINVLKYNPLELAKIKGINENKAREISQSFIENWEVWNIVKFLEKFNIGIENSKKIYDELGIDAINKIKDNPYILIEFVHSIDFKKIDDIAIDLGIELTNIKRIISGIKYCLIQITYNGHSCVLLQNLEEYVSNLLNVSTEFVEDGIIHLKAKGDIVIENRDDDLEWVYLVNFYNTEFNIARRIIDLNKSKNIKKIKNFKNELELQEKINKIELSSKQKEAISFINENNVTIITGGPGTGKTTIIKTIIDIYNKQSKKVVLTAPTRKSCKKNDRNDRI